MRGFPTMVVPSLGSTVAFLVIVASLCAGLVLAVARAGRLLGEPPETTRRWTLATAALVLGVLGVTGALSASSILERAGSPPPLMVFALGNLALAAALAFSPLGTRLVKAAPIAWLVGYQAFRLPLELVLHAWYEQGVLPVQMTFEGDNLDIVSGLLGLTVGLWAHYRGAPRALLWLFNVVGTGLLARVAMIALTSSPVPLRQYWNEPPVLLAYHFPYGWILPVCVGGALLGHLLVFRWLLRS